MAGLNHIELRALHLEQLDSSAFCTTRARYPTRPADFTRPQTRRGAVSGTPPPPAFPEGSGSYPRSDASMPKARGKAAAKSNKVPSSNATAAAQAPAAPPSWPVFRPPLPLTDLQPEPLLDSRVLLVRKFWPRSLCRDYVSFLRALPLTTTPGQPKRGDAVRVNDRFQVQDQGFANRLWLETGLKQVLLGEEWEDLW